MTGCVRGSTIARMGRRAAGRAADGASPAAVGGQRALLVLSRDHELAVALRDRLDRALVTVAEVRPEEALTAVRACRPWPWMVAGDLVTIDVALARLLTARPTLLLWRGPPPPELSARVISARLFSDLVELVEAALGTEVYGIRLSVGSGLTMPGGGHATSPALEALVAGHPRSAPLTPAQVRAANRTLSAHAVPLRAWRGPGGAVLAGPA